MQVEPSYVHGTGGVPLLGETIGVALTRAASLWPDRPAMTARAQGIRWTWRELDERAEAMAAGLLALGLEPGDRVGIWSPNRAEWTLTQFATAKAGLVLVNINPGYRSADLEYALNKVGCRALVTATAFKSSDYVGMLNDLLPELRNARPAELKAARCPDLRCVIQVGADGKGVSSGCIAFEAVSKMGGARESERIRRLAETLQFDDPINIQFTSGTTGTPKGATLTHHNILNNGYFVGRMIDLTVDDRVCIPVPLYHCFGMVLGNLACLALGACMVYPGEGFDALATLETIAEERCTALYGVPTMFIAELDHPRLPDFDLTSLRTGIMAGSPCPVEVMRRVADRLHMKQVTIAYGMTETSPISFQSRATDPLELRVTTIGQILPHVEAKVVDPEGRIVPRGTPGELLIRGYSVMPGYWDDEARTAKVLDRSRWMHTGDLATIDRKGFCNIVGRIKDMIIRGGENVSPREVEEFLYRHPKIQDVQVFGVPDARYGEEICAWIRPRPGEAMAVRDVLDFCAGEIAHNKVPRHIRFVDQFPMTITGKIKKFEMRDEMIRELGLETAATA